MGIFRYRTVGSAYGKREKEKGLGGEGEGGKAGRVMQFAQRNI